VKARRPSALTLVTCALLVLLPTLAVLQYRWVGQVADAERERRPRILRTAAFQFREEFDGEIVRAATGLRIDATTVREGAWYRFGDRYENWSESAGEPRIVANVFLIDAEEDGTVRIRRWNATSHQFEDSPWTGTLADWRPQFQAQHDAFIDRRPIERLPGMREDDTLIALPLLNVGPRQPLRDGERPRPVFGFTVLQLDLPFIVEQWLPQLVERHFRDAAEGDNYRVSVLRGLDSSQVVYASDASAPTDPSAADAAEPLHGAFLGGPLFRRGPGDDRDARRGTENRRDGDGRSDDERRDGDGRAGRERRDEDGGRRPFDVLRGAIDGGGPASVQARLSDRPPARWTMLLQHERGSLEAAVAATQRRNLGISFGILLLLSLTVGLLAATSRKAERLGRQQMEFVAGVSHELRTPVAVLRSAGENLSQGVVASKERVRQYGEMIETEARRLGDMVERVLLYAGIESGLGMARRESLAPSELIASAVEAASSTLPEARIERAIAENLPPVLGDAAALRSAVQNLIVNAVKYGSRDGWVGIRAERNAGGRRDEVRIAVSDHGAGIDARDLPHIWEPFYRGHSATAQQVHGNGLGLSLVKRIVTAHGGRVSVDTEPGAGSTFTIALPVAEQTALTSESPAVQPIEGAARS
jgi:signal transduction histidine kinase